MSNPEPTGSVLLAEQRAASNVLHDVLANAAAAYPEDLAAVGLPVDPRAFRGAYANVLPRFEAARLASRNRSEIARHLVSGLQRHVVWQDRAGSRPLHQALREEVEPLSLQTQAFSGSPGWQPTFVYRGERWNVTRLTELGALLVQRRVITPDAAASLAWVEANALEGGELRLPGRKIAVLGGGAEMAPTRFWLEAGADVLWVDITPPPENWRTSTGMSGRLFRPIEGTLDLLTQPREVLATLVAFADGDPLDLCLYAYAPGQARELRLTGTMNAIVDALPPELVGSVTMLVSPTTPTALSAGDQTDMDARLQARPAWEAALARVGLLGHGGGSVAAGNGAATRSVVTIQGASYQAAQYLGKVLTAECWTAHDPQHTATPQPLRVSANTAAITRTRSLDHPVFAAAFGGAGAFGVETFTPRQSRCLNGLLAVRDWLATEPPVPGRVRVHGGIHTLPYPLEAALRVAATFGFARSPRLLRGLIRT